MTSPSEPTGPTSAAPSYLAHFEIVRELGRGGMGVVYLARQKSLDRLVALKVLNTDHKSAASLLTRFRREAMNVVRLKHPNLVHLYDFDAAGPSPYLVIELIEGERSLKDAIEEGRYSWSEGLLYAMELASVVAYLHENGIVHRDLKPANVLLDRQGHPRLADFGVSRDTDPNSTQLTMDGQVVGTLSYMAPEQAFGESASFRSDVYGLALVLCEILAKKLIFGGSKPIVSPPERFNKGAPSLMKHCPRATAELDRLLTRCLSHTAANRPADAREVLTAISGIVERDLGKDTGQTEVIKQQIAKYTVDLRTVEPVSPDTARVPAPTSPRRVEFAALRPSPQAQQTPPVAPGRAPVVVPVACVFVLAIASAWATWRSSAPRVTAGASAKWDIPSSSPSVDCAAGATTLAASLMAVAGSDGRQIETALEALRWPLKTGVPPGGLRELLERVLPVGSLSRLDSALSTACPLVTTRDGVTSIDQSLFSQLASVELLDEVALSLGEPEPFTRARKVLTGPYADVREMTPLRGEPIFGYHASPSYKGPERGEWVLDLPKLPDGDVDLTLIANDLDPKVVVEVSVNRAVNLNFRNRSGIAGRDRYDIPKFVGVSGTKSDVITYTSEGPFPRFTALTRRVPRSTLRTGPNRIGLRFIHLPGPLKLPGGKTWRVTGSLSYGSIWHAYLAVVGVPR